jgi:magnesium transporter
VNETYSLVTYTQEKITHNAGVDLADLLAQVDDDCNIWVTVNGYSAADREAIAQLFSFFEIDPSMADDLVDENRPAFKGETRQYLFIDYTIPFQNSPRVTDCFVRGTVILNHRAVILFDQDRSGYFDSLRDKILAGNTRAQEFGPDYIFYLLLRTALANVKRFMLVDLVDRFETLEDEVIDNPGEDFVLDDILALRQQVRPLYDPLLSSRELIDYVLEEESRFIAPHTRRLFERHLEKDSDQLWEGYSQLRDWSSVLLEIHRSNMGEKSNKKLNMVTIITFIFLPITFLTGLYGMNFAYMPELEGRYNYYILLGLMLVIAIVMVTFIKRKKLI